MNIFKKLDADIAIVVAYGQIIPKEYLSLVKKGFINIHASTSSKMERSSAQFKDQL